MTSVGENEKYADSRTEWFWASFYVSKSACSTGSECVNPFHDGLYLKKLPSVMITVFCDVSAL
jgi:hypothetical protein